MRYILTSNINIEPQVPGEIYYISPACFYGNFIPRTKETAKKILSSPFNNDELENSFKIISETHSSLIPKLTSALNQIHKLNFSEQYWEGLLSLWLLYFISTAYERYLRLKNVLNRFKKDQIFIVTSNGINPAVPVTVSNFIAAVDFNYNNIDFYVYSRLAKILGFKFYDVPVKNKEPEYFPPGRINTINEMKYEITNLKNKLAGLFGNNIIFTPVYNYFFGIKDSFKAFPALIRIKDYNYNKSGCPINKSARGAFEKIKGANEFETCIISLLPEFLPAVYLELYSKIRAKAEKFIKRAVFLNTASAWHENYAFTYAAFESREKYNSIIVSMTSGGGYGQYKYFIPEYIDRKISDIYLSWGWKDSYYGGAEIIKAPSIRASSIMPKNISQSENRDKKGCFVSTTGSPYLFRNNLWSLYEGFEEYFEEQLRFYKALKPDVAKKIIYRPYPHKKYLWNNVENFKKNFPHVTIDSKDKMTGVIKTAKILILDHNITTLCDAVALNIPIVCYWKNNLYPVRSSAAGDFQLLRDVEILHDNPESAAKCVNNIWDNVDLWWNEEKRQNAVIKFARKYAYASVDYKKEWSNVFKTLKDYYVRDSRNYKL